MNGALLPERLVAPFALTDLEQQAFDWARDAVVDCAQDPDWLADNPGYDLHLGQQVEDLLYRLEEQARDMAEGTEPGSEEKRGALAARRAARKVRSWWEHQLETQAR